MDIPKYYIIHDTRIAKDFKGVSICGYKRLDVIKQYQNCIINNRLEDSIRWCVELHATCLNKQLWDIIKSTYIKYIHINNPKLYFYILKREKDYKSIISNFPKKHEIFTRNNQELRNLFSELTAILTLNKKNNIFVEKSLPTISNKSFNNNEIRKRIISKNLDNIHQYVNNSTTSEMKLALNEILTNLSNKNGTYQNCIYWYIWIDKIEKYIKSNSKILIKECEYEDHWVFIIWNIILNFKNNLHKKDAIFIKKLYDKYKYNFKLSQMNQKKYYLFICFYIIKNNINWNIILYPQEHLIIQSNCNINSMYENIIKNIESNLTSESKIILYKNYYKLLNNDEKENIKKIKDTNLDTEINKVLFTNHPEYKIITEEVEDNYFEEPVNNLISKNMTERDIQIEKIEKQQKKLDMFSNFVSYKKSENILEPKKKSVLDYYEESKNKISNDFKNITFSKRK